MSYSSIPISSCADHQKSKHCQIPDSRNYTFSRIQSTIFFPIRTVCRHHRRKTHWLGGSLCCSAAHHYQSLSVREIKKKPQLNNRPAASANWDRNFTRVNCVCNYNMKTYKMTHLFHHFVGWLNIMPIILCQQFDCLALGGEEIYSNIYKHQF